MRRKDSKKKKRDCKLNVKLKDCLRSKSSRRNRLCKKDKKELQD